MEKSNRSIQKPSESCKSGKSVKLEKCNICGCKTDITRPCPECGWCYVPEVMD